MSSCCLETKCIQCCIETNMILSYRDIEIIQKMGYDRQFFVSERNAWLQLKNHQGRCVFHNGTRCTIYHQKPEGCTLYPVVYDKDNHCAILDSECPQKHCFHLSKVKSEQLEILLSVLEKERTERKKEKELKKYYCKICKREVIPRDMKRTTWDGVDDSSSPQESSEKRTISLHHIDYKNNIAIRVCKDCHNKLHTTMKKHKYGYNNIIRRDGTKKGRLSPGDYPKKIIE